MRPLGARQLETLILCSSVGSLLLTPDKAADSLVRCGLLTRDGGAQGITAAGLRRLADEMDAGRVVPALKRIKAQVAERRAAARARTERRTQS